MPETGPASKVEEFYMWDFITPSHYVDISSSLNLKVPSLTDPTMSPQAIGTDARGNMSLARTDQSVAGAQDPVPQRHRRRDDADGTGCGRGSVRRPQPSALR